MSIQVQSGTYATPRMDLGVAFWEFVPAAAKFVATQALALFRTPKKSGQFSKITREGLLARSETKRSTGGAYQRINLYTEPDSYTCEEHGLENPLDDGDRENYASEFNAELAATRTLWLRLMIELEIRAKTLLFSTSTWTGASLYTDNSGNPWDTASTDIIGQVLAAKEKVRLNTGIMPNALLLGAATLANMLKNTGIKAQFPGAALITEAMIQGALPAIMGLERLIVGGAVYNSAFEGQSFSGTDLWTDDYAMVAVVANEDDPLDTPCVGRTFLWEPDSPDIATVEQYREEQTRSDIFRIRQNVDEKIFDANFAHLMKVDA